MKHDLMEALDAMKKLSPLLLAGAGQASWAWVFYGLANCSSGSPCKLCQTSFARFCADCGLMFVTASRLPVHILQQQGGEGT